MRGEARALDPEPTAPGPEPRGPLPAFDWREPEVGWPLSLLAGFGGTWLGIRAGIPGLPWLLAAGIFAPLFASLIGHGRRRLAAALAVGWALGITAAVTGSAFEYGWPRVSGTLPGSGFWTEMQLESWRELAAGEGFSLAVMPLLWTAAGLLSVLAAARAVQGLGSILVLGGLLGLWGSAAAQVSVLARAAGYDHVTAALLGWTPFAALQLLGAILAGVALAEPGPVWLLPQRRSLLVAGGAALVLGLLLQGVFEDSWSAWLASRGALGPG